MFSRFIAHIQQQHLFPTGQQVLLAVSGGVDSVVLLHLMQSAGYPFAVAHCNFNLRPGDCDRDEAFVRHLADTCGVPCHVVQFDTLAYARQQHLCVEDAARRLRYQYFQQLCQEHGYPAILTAHHRDDAAETFFLNLLRGTGLAGLHGLRAVNGLVVRPLLIFGRDEILAYARQHSLSYVEDATNADTRYRRNAIRHQLMPLLRQLQPAADDAIQQTIVNLQSVEQHYQHLLEPLRRRCLMPQPDGTLRLDLGLAADPDAPQLYFELLRPYGFNAAAVRQLLSASQPGRAFLSATHRLFLDRGCAYLAPLCADNAAAVTDVSAADNALKSSPDALQTFDPRIQVQVMPYTRNLDLRHQPLGTILLDADTLRMPLSLRHWRRGDRFQPLGMAHGTQLLSDYFTDHKYTLLDKQSQLLLVDADDRILALLPLVAEHIAQPVTSAQHSATSAQHSVTSVQHSAALDQYSAAFDLKPKHPQRTTHPHRVTPATSTILKVVFCPL